MRIRIAAACAAALLTLSSAGAQQPATTSPPVLTASQWRDDLKFIAAELQKRHANLYHHVSRGDFERAVAALDRQIPNLPRNRIIVGMMRIAAMVGDGHTRVEPRKDPAFGFASRSRSSTSRGSPTRSDRLRTSGRSSRFGCGPIRRTACST